ncbi:MAG: hypothetical protein J6T16_06095 [Opitutales bacterium]|nr:hypothetical protein [Opitutales bacterium]
MKPTKVYVMGVGALIGFVSANAQSLNQFELNSNWKLQDAEIVHAEAVEGGWFEQGQTKLPEEGKRLSTGKYEPQKWYEATVPGTILTTLVNNKVYEEPLYDENNRPEKIPESLCRKDWWYRTVVNIPENFRGKRIWLKFTGINYNSEVWLNGRKLGNINGAFIRENFDITKDYRVDPGKDSVIAVRVSPPPNPGVPSEHTMGTTSGPCNGESCMDAASFSSSQGWDWQSGIRDRNSGIWNKVYIAASGDVIIKDPYVKTDLPNLPKLDVAEVSVDVPVQNVCDYPKKANVSIDIEGIKLEKQVELAPWESAVASFTPKEFPALKILKPRIWWCNGLGKPELYKLSIKADVNGEESDAKSLNFGIRKFEYFEEGNKNFALSINGVRVFMKGGNWGMDEALKRLNRERLETQIRMHRDANLNMIRNWGGQSRTDELAEFCDKYGIMLWEEFWQFAEPQNIPVYLANMRDKILAYRNHPSIVLWCGRNEATPPKYLNDKMRALVLELDPLRHYQANSGDKYGFNSGGPYDWYPTVSYQRYLENPRFNKNETFKTEIGALSVPTIESIQGMFPESEWYGITDSWGEHNFCSGGGRKHIRFMTTRLGAPKNLADFVRKSQLMNYECHRAMYEGRLTRMFKPAQGVLLWMSIPSQPSFVWQIIQYDLEPNASFFAVKKACEPIHIQYSETDGGIVQIVNHTAKPLAGLTAKLWIYNLDGTVAYKRDIASLKVPATGVETVCNVVFPKELSKVHFIKLELWKGKTRLDENFYWHNCEANPQDAKDLNDDNKLARLDDMKDLESMPEVMLDASAEPRESGNVVVINVSLKNSSENIALLTHLQLQGRKSKKRILPAFYSDNYISLAPKEKRSVTIKCKKSDLAGDAPVVKVDGWNVKVRETAYVSQNKNADVSNPKWGEKGFGFMARPPVRKEAVRINCGGYNRGDFEKDPGFLESWVGYRTEDMDISGLKDPAPGDVYRTVRWSDSVYYAYLKGLPGSKYTVRLHFAEQSEDKVAGRRAFDVKINDKVVLKDYDVAKAAGRPRKGVIEEIYNVASDSDGIIKLEFVGGQWRSETEHRDAQISGSEVMPQ